MVDAYFYSSTAVSTTLSAGCTDTATTVQVASTTGFPTSYPYNLILGYGSATQEVVTVTSAATVTLTVTRGQDGTAGSAHSFGDVVIHGVIARDVRLSRTHEAASTNIHGLAVASAVVGTTDV